MKYLYNHDIIYIQYTEVVYMKPREFLLSIGSAVTVVDAAAILNIKAAAATKILSRWTKQGWLERVGHGLYVPNPLSSTEVSSSDGGFAIVSDIIGEEGYICGWSALMYHGITEQIFHDLSLASFKWSRNKKIKLQKSTCYIYKIHLKDTIGLKVLWHNNKKVFISDMHKTILDILSHPSCGAGFMHVVDCFRNYFNSSDCNIDQILKYAEASKIKGVFYKRLGYLLEVNKGDQTHIDYCFAHKSSGYSRLDPKTKEGSFCSRWQLIIPKYIII